MVTEKEQPMYSVSEEERWQETFILVKVGGVTQPRHLCWRSAPKEVKMVMHNNRFHPDVIQSPPTTHPLTMWIHRKQIQMSGVSLWSHLERKEHSSFSATLQTTVQLPIMWSTHSCVAALQVSISFILHPTLPAPAITSHPLPSPLLSPIFPLFTSHHVSNWFSVFLCLFLRK